MEYKRNGKKWKEKRKKREEEKIEMSSQFNSKK